MTDITELTSVQKNANIHRLSRLIAYASNDELRQLAVEVEHFTVLKTANVALLRCGRALVSFCRASAPRMA